MQHYYVYIMASQPNGTLYTGITGNLTRRVYEHKSGFGNGFTAKYNLRILVYFEQYQDPENAIMREKQIKKMKRSKKITLIEKLNPTWADLDIL